MNKLFKGMLTTFLAVGFLAGCGGETSDSTPVSSEPVVTHWVTFWEDNVGKFYEEVEVEHGETVDMPADPAREGYTFEGWYLETTFDTVFDPETPIVEDLDVYADWAKEYVPDTRTFHLIGDLQNTEYENSWNTGVDHYTNTHMTVADDQNLFTIEIEIGWMGKFKVKEPGAGWDEGQEYDFTDIPEALVPEYVVEGDTRNVQVTTAGLYRVQVETDLGELYIERLGDAAGEGVKPDPDPNSVLAWGLVGSMTWSNWGAIEDLQPEYFEADGYHLFRAVHFVAGDQFKFRTDNAWGVELGYSENAVLPGEEFIKPEMEGEEGAQTPKSGGNLIVQADGFYTITIQKVEEVNVLTIAPTEFVLRGTSLATGWDADFGTALSFDGAETVEEVTTYTYSGVYTLAEGQFKVKLAGVGPYAGWDNAFGDATTASTNFEVTAGDYTVTLVVTFDAATNMFVGAATVTPVVA